MRKYWGCEMDSPIYRQVAKEMAKAKIKVKTDVKKRGKYKTA